MSLFTVLRTYLEFSLLCALLGGGLVIVLRLFPRAIRSHRALLRSAYALLAICLLLPFAFAFLPKESLFRPEAQVWSGGSKNGAPYSLIAATSSAAPRTEPALAVKIEATHLRAVGLALLLLAGLSVLFTGFQVARLRLSMAKLPLLRRIGRVRIYASSAYATAFSTRGLFTRDIVLPTDLLTDPKALRIAVAHELEHHRNGDTSWLYAFELLRAAQFWNPLARLLVRSLHELQELACDESLIGRQRISPQAYSRCLLQAAESAVALRSPQACAACMARSRDGFLLKRRIHMILKPATGQKAFVPLFTLAISCLLATAAFAAKSALQDRSLTEKEAAAYASTASKTSELPISMNEMVLKRLNRIVGTEEGRQWFKSALARLPRYEAMIEKKLKARGLPEDLIAVAIFESGLRNDLISAAPYRAAGIWQFIAQTARNYGLTVNDSMDERFDEEKLTDAAAAYYSNLYSLFSDWRLTLKAYNEGESAVQRQIRQHGTRDAWELERRNGRESYLAGVTAVLIVLKNPELLR